MSGSPTSPPSNVSAGLPPAAGAGQWIQLEEPVPHEASEDGDEAEVIGCILAYARSANARMRVVVTEGKDGSCAMLFNFGSEEEKEEFLRLLLANRLTRRRDSEILIPDPVTILAARPAVGSVFRGHCVQNPGLRGYCGRMALRAEARHVSVKTGCRSAWAGTRLPGIWKTQSTASASCGRIARAPWVKGPERQVLSAFDLPDRVSRTVCGRAPRTFFIAA